ncbi:MAG TPA: DNA gyrase C-terminal beta-propeller domain-containing protein, partial [Anaeromyxobacteraceae bacterium]|nr:DNA gyrase C-terminal beta-propeller domain-containing protein [Anaeromyxobacteraceae bacterium]
EHVLLGFQIALDHLDQIIEIIKKAPDGEAAREGLTQRFGLSEIQAKAILDLQLRRLTGLERRKILDELTEVQQVIARLKEILASEKVLLEVIVKELEEVRDLFGDDRRTEIRGAADAFEAEDLIKEEEMVVTVSHLGYVKRNPVSTYRAQRRGGRGKTGVVARDEDFVEMLFVASTHSYLLVFSDRGKVYWLKVHEIPQAGRAARGKPIVNLVQLAQGEKVAAILPVARLPEPPAGAEEGEGEAPGAELEAQPQPDDGQYVFQATRRGLVKKTRLDAYSRPRASGIIALSIEEGDELIAARLTDGASHILLSTAQGMAIRFEESDVRAMGRATYGVKGITLEQGDEVVSAESLAPPRPEEREVPTILTVTRNGYGKRTELSEYRVQSRGGKGIITIKTTERNGPVVAAAPAHDGEEVMLITNRGMLIRLPVKQISVIGRNTQGVRLIAVESKDELVAAVARVAETGREADAAGVRDAPEAGGNGNGNGNGETAAAGKPGGRGGEDGEDEPPEGGAGGATP